MSGQRRKQFPTKCKHAGCRELTHNVYCEKHKRYRDDRKNAYQRGYNARWNRYRRTFLMNHPLCARCGKMATVVDHITPHKGNKSLFWDVNNHQALCEKCHNRKTRLEDMGSW